MKTISEMIEESICCYADRIAVVANGESLTYREVGVRCGVIISSLINHGIDKKHLLAIISNRSVDTYCQIISCLLCGVQYTIIEMEQGSAALKERVSQISPFALLAPSGPGNGYDLENFENIPVIKCASASADGATMSLSPAPSDVAYVLYTSGSTGVPKGVQVTHANVYQYTKALIARLSIASPLSYAHISTLAADLGNTSLFLSPATGGTLHLIDEVTKRDPTSLLRYLQSEKIDVLKITPSHWSAVLSSLSNDYLAPHALSRLVLGGEELKAGLVVKTLNAGLSERVFNHYGPTETTVGIATFEATQYAHTLNPGEPIPIGYPLGDTKVYVAFEGQYQSSACVGELLVTGPSVSLGYRNLERQTQERYIQIAVDGLQVRAYLTGDIVRLDASGCMTFIGRSDRQVKISGYRVELADIERELARVCDIEDCQVHYFTRGDKSWLLAAYTGWVHDSDQLREVALKRMQQHTIPVFFHHMVSIPRNANGKSDLKAVKSILEHALECWLECNFSKRVEPLVYKDIESIKIACDIRLQFSKILGQNNFDDDTNFFNAGGNSLDGVLLVASLQLMGYLITGSDFIECPSVKRLTELVRIKLDSRPENPAKAESLKDDARKVLSAAQKEFVSENYKDPNLYLQTLLYSTAEVLCERSLEAAANCVVNSHGLLTTSFACSSDSCVITPATSAGGCFHVHYIESCSDIEELTRNINSSICLEEGNVFGVHYIRSDQKAYLYLVAHHLVIDVISWRIIINELSISYLQAREGKKLEALPTISTFWQWAESVERAVDVSAANSYHKRLQDFQQNTVKTIAQRRTEGDCETFWFALSSEDSIQFDDFCRTNRVGANVALLAVFAHAWGGDSAQRFVVDVESHGRLNVSRATDNSRLVGWHTSTYPVGINVSSSSLEETVSSVDESLKNVPRMGVDISWAAARGDVSDAVRPEICYNYLGNTDFPFDAAVGLSQAYLKTSEARSFGNIRQHEIKVSVQFMSGQYVVDISYPSSATANEYEKSCQSLRSLIANSLEISEESIPYHITSGTSTGQISFVPEQLCISTCRSRVKTTDGALLVTGATGYIGIYFVREVLLQSDERMVILARAESDADAQVRFNQLWKWYFPEVKLEAFLHRISFKAGDVSESLLGLSPESFGLLSKSVTSIFNFAADIRLFASEHDLGKVNVRGVENLINLSRRAGDIDLHHMSTLAVAGLYGGEQLKVFSERDLNVGQTFQNSYEATKYRAEALLLDYALEGGSVYVYRTGNVSGDLMRGKFQRNGAQNRLIQLIKACVKIGKIPFGLDDEVNLTPVDVVAEGMAKIAFSDSAKPGMYHIDSPNYIRLTSLFECLEKLGFRFVRTNHESLKKMFSEVNSTSDPDIALGVFWSSRPSRNVEFDCKSTLQLLERLGTVIPKLSEQWIESFIRLLVENKVLEQPDPNVVHIDRFLRSRIFSIPSTKSIRREVYSAANL